MVWFYHNSTASYVVMFKLISLLCGIPHFNHFNDFNDFNDFNEGLLILFIT